MIRLLKRYAESCGLDRPGVGASGEFADVHRRLSEPAPMQNPSPTLRSRIMRGLHEASGPAPIAGSWRWALAGVACLLLTAALIPALSHRPAAAPFTGPLALQIPVGASPVFRMVSGSVDKPLLDQAQKMYDDTRRATRMVASCVPFARRGS